MSAPHVHQIQQNILDRLKEVQALVEPLVVERDTLATVAAFLDGESPQVQKPDTRKAAFDHASRAAVAAHARESTIKARASKPRARAKRPSSRTTGRPACSRLGKRATQALVIIDGEAGITVPELAEKMGVKNNYLYRLLPGLANRGLLRRRRRGWFTTPTGSQLVVARSGGMEV